MSLLLALLGPTSSQLVGTPLLSNTNSFPEQIVHRVELVPYEFKGTGISPGPSGFTGSVTATFEAGETVFVVLLNDITGTGPATVTDGTNTYTQLYLAGREAVFKADNVAAGTFTLVGDMNGGSGFQGISYYRYAGLQYGASETVVSASFSGNGTAYNDAVANVIGTTVTPAKAPSMLFEVFGAYGGSTSLVKTNINGRNNLKSGDTSGIVGDVRATTLDPFTAKAWASPSDVFWNWRTVGIATPEALRGRALFPDPIQSSNAFFQPTIAVVGAAQTLTPALYTNTNDLFNHTVSDRKFTILPKIVKTQPRRASVIDWSNPVNNGLDLAFIGGSPIDHTRKYDLVPAAKVLNSVNASGLNSVGSAGYYNVIPPLPASGTEFTIVVRMRYLASNEQAYFAKGTYFPAESKGQFNFITNGNAGLNLIRLETYGAGGVITGSYSTTSLVSGQVYVIAATYKAGAVSFYVNGVLDGTATAPAIVPTPTPFTTVLKQPGGGSATGGVNFLAVWNTRALTAEEVRKVSTNVWSTFKAANAPVYLKSTAKIEYLLVPLYSNSNTYYAPTISVIGGGTQTLISDLYSNTNTYYNPTITVGGVTLLDPLYTNSNTLYSATVSTGAVTLALSLYSNSTTLYAPTASIGAATVLPGLYSNTNTYYTPTITVGGVTLLDPLYTNSNTLYTATVNAGVVTLTPSLYSNTNSYYNPVITTGGVTLTPSLYSNSTTYYNPTITVIGVTQALNASLLTNSSTLYTSTAIAGSTLVTDNWAGSGFVDGKTPTTGGGTWQIGSGGSGVLYGSGNATPDGDYASAYHSATYQNAQFSTVVYPADIFGTPLPCSIIGRAATQSPGFTCYLAEFDSFNSTVKLKKLIAGTPTDLATVSVNCSGAAASLIISGSILKVILNNSEIISVTDTSITAAGYWGFAVRFGAIGEDLANSAIGPVSIKSASIAIASAILPSLYSNTNTYYNPTIAVGGVTLLDPLYTNSVTLYTPTISAGVVTLIPDLYSSTNIYYIPTVAVSAVALTTGLYSNSSTYYVPTITVGSVTLTPGLYTNSSAYYTSTITVGTVALTPSLYTNTSTLYTGNVGLVQLLSAPIITSTNIYYTPTIAVGVVTLTPSLYSSTNNLYTPTIATGVVAVTAPLLSNVNTLLAPTAIPGVITATPPVLANSNVYYLPTLTRGPVALSPTLFTNTNTYYTPSIVPGTVGVQLPTIASNSATYAPEVYGTAAGIIPGNIVVDIPSANVARYTETSRWIPTLVVNNVVTFVEVPYYIVNVDGQHSVMYSDSLDYILDKPSGSVSS